MKRYIKSAKGNPKNITVYVSQEYVPGYGWEDIVEYDDMSSESLKEAKQDVKDYLDNGYNARVIKRKLANPNYAEPENNITVDEAGAWLDNSPYELEKLFSGDWKTMNFVVKQNENAFGKAQVFLRRGDTETEDTVEVRNIGTNRTKRVYTIDEFESAVNKIMQGR